MSSYTLIIGNKNLSSWSLRAWLMLRATGTSFDEIAIALDGPDTAQEILRHSPSGKVPLLSFGNQLVWDSMAIGETLAELFPRAGLWPADSAARAQARSISAEMHSGFQALRTHHPMDMKKRVTVKPEPQVQECVDRIEQIWAGARESFGRDKGDFLYGNFTIADAMYAPVVSRFVTYGFTVSKESAAYMEAIRNLVAYRQWYASAQKEV